jgi:DNA-binding MarR family transcriptional regulator
MGLAHSTVSGIVDRLEHKKLVHRQLDLQDRRYIRICLNQAVREYMTYQSPSHVFVNRKTDHFLPC